jgi:glycosyltransferase involved in cell wall biosynthesis
MLDVAIASILESPLITSPEQVIVIDDDSQDETAEVSRHRSVTYRRVNYHNISETRNAGFALVHTAFVTFLDHDDAWLPGNMCEQLATLEAQPEVAFAYGIGRCATEDLEPLPWLFPSPPLVSGLAPERLHLDYPNLGVVLFRREAVEEVGGFDPRIVYQQDGDLMIRVAARHRIVGIEFVGMLHRMRAASKKRADYYWKHRSVTHWSPKHVGVGWRTAARLCFKVEGTFYHRFCEDAQACVAAGQRRNALECVFRAVRISPVRAARHVPTLASIVLQSALGPTAEAHTPSAG